MSIRMVMGKFYNFPEEEAKAEWPFPLKRGFIELDILVHANDSVAFIRE